MSIHNAIKYGSQLLRPYSRILGLGEDEEGTVRLGETLTPTFDQWAHPEAAVERGEVLLARGNVQAAVAGQFAALGVGIAADARHMAVVEALSWSDSVNNLISIERLTIAAITAGVASLGASLPVRDARGRSSIAGPFGQTLLFSGTSLTASLAADNRLEFMRVLGNSTVTAVTAVPCVLGPGDAIVMISQVANQGSHASLQLRERPRLPGEQ